MFQNQKQLMLNICWVNISGSQLSASIYKIGFWKLFFKLLWNVDQKRLLKNTEYFKY